MAKLIVWECDHCGNHQYGEAAPDNWVIAKAFVVSVGNSTKDWLWCGRCWDEFKSVLPKEARTGND